MDIQTMKREYSKFKEALEKTVNKVNELENKHSYLEDERIIAKASIITAKRNKDENAKNNAEEYLKKIDAELEQIKDDLFYEKEKVEILKVRVNMRIDAMKENPQVAQELNSEMSKVHEERLEELDKEEEELFDKKDRMEEFKKLANGNPEMADSLRKVIITTATLKDLEKDLQGLKVQIEGGAMYKDPDKANAIMQLISQAKEEISNNKAKLMEYIKENNLSITEKDIDALADMAFVQDEKGKVDVENTVDMATPSINREIMSRENARETNLRGMEEIAKAQRGEIQNVPRQPSTVFQYEQGPLQMPQERNSYQPAQTYEQSLVPIGNAPRWYQFIQRFRNWRNEKKEIARSKEDNEINAAIDKEERLEELKQAVEERPELKRSLQYLLDVKSKIADRKNEKSTKLSKYLLVGGTGALLLRCTSSRCGISGCCCNNWSNWCIISCKFWFGGGSSWKYSYPCFWWYYFKNGKICKELSRL